MLEVLCSSGNHGAALAHAARRADTSATIIIPKTAPACKVAAARAAGATVVMCDATMQSRQEAAATHAENYPLDTFIPPYNHPDIIAGQGTIGLELLEQNAKGDIVHVGTSAAAGTILFCCCALPRHASFKQSPQHRVFR